MVVCLVDMYGNIVPGFVLQLTAVTKVLFVMVLAIGCRVSCRVG